MGSLDLNYYPCQNDHSIAMKDHVVKHVDDDEVTARVSLSRPVIKTTIPEDQSTARFASLQANLHSWANGQCRKKTLYENLLSLFPLLAWFPSYPWKTDLMPDILAGLTVGIMSIPQGMAYARLAAMPPVYGLYTNIIPTVVYFFLGTTRHAAIGPTTVLCLIMSNIRYKMIPCEDCWMSSANESNSTFDEDFEITDPTLTPIDVGSAVAFLVGIFLIAMGIFRLAFIADYLPDPFVGGFTMAAAVQVFAGQLSSIFGIKLPKRRGIGKVVMNLFDLFTLISMANLATLLVFSVCFVFLIFSKHILNPRFQSKLKIPFPGELVVMVIATIASHFANFRATYGVSVVRKIAAGMPAPTVPQFSIMNDIWLDSLILAIISYSYSISLAKLYAKRNGYSVDSTQEFYAYGAMNFISSFFQCFNSGQSVARSLVYEMAGARSQLCGLFGTLVVIFTVLFIAPFLESLPNAALAAIIVTAVVEMLVRLAELPALFRKSKYDFAIYMVTFLCVVVLGIAIGLAVSVGFALVTVVIRSQRGRVEKKNEALLLYSSDDVPNADHLSQTTFFWCHTKILQLTSPLFYVNADKVKNHILKKSLSLSVTNDNEKGQITLDDSDCTKAAMQHPLVIILDMSAASFTDVMGINVLKEVAQRLKLRGISFYLAACTARVEKMLKNTGFLDNPENGELFPTVLDAITYAQFEFGQRERPSL